MTREDLRVVEWKNYGYIDDVKNRENVEVAYFHQFFNEVTLHGTTRLKAIIENKEGRVYEVFPHDIRFV